MGEEKGEKSNRKTTAEIMRTIKFCCSQNSIHHSLVKIVKYKIVSCSALKWYFVLTKA